MEDTEFWHFDEEWEQERMVKRRIQVMHRLAHPECLLESILASIVSRIAYSFDNEKFGVVSAFRDTNTKIQNFKNQYSLAKKIQGLGLRYDAHLGFWDEISQRCLFIPRIEQRILKSLAHTFKQHSYIWGEKGHWTCFRTKNNCVLTAGSDLRIVDADEEFLLYCKIERKISSLSQQLTEVENSPSNSSPSGQQTTSCIRRQILDFKRLQQEMVKGKH